MNGVCTCHVHRFSGTPHPDSPIHCFVPSAFLTCPRSRYRLFGCVYPCYVASRRSWLRELPVQALFQMRTCSVSSALEILIHIVRSISTRRLVTVLTLSVQHQPEVRVLDATEVLLALRRLLLLPVSPGRVLQFCSETGIVAK